MFVVKVIIDLRRAYMIYSRIFLYASVSRENKADSHFQNETTHE